MNFKDAYKSCNDDIVGNREILTSILSGEAVSKKRFNYTPILACAALVVIAVSVSVFGFIGDNGINPDDTALYIASNENGNTSVYDSKEIPEDSFTENLPEPHQGAGLPGTDNQIPQSVAPGSAYSGADKHSKTDKFTSDIQNDLTESYIVADENAGNTVKGTAPESAKSPDVDSSDEKKASANTGIKAKHPDNEASDATSDVSVSTDEIMTASEASERASGVYKKYEDMSPEEDEEFMRRFATPFYIPPASDKASGGSGGGGSASSGAAVSGKGISSDEYYKYIGFNIESMAKLPDDMFFNGKADITFEKSGSEVINDSVLLCAVSANNPERNISIYASKTNSFSSNTEAVINGDDSSNSAVVCIKGVSVSIDSSGVSIAEIEKLIESLG